MSNANKNTQQKVHTFTKPNLKGVKCQHKHIIGHHTKFAFVQSSIGVVKC